MKNRPFEGAVRITKHSGLRKLMRAARRDMIPPERQIVIDIAMEKSKKRGRYEKT